MGQSKARHELELVNVQPGIHEDKVHLAEGEHHLQDGVDSSQNLIARRVPWDFEEIAQFHSVVNHTTQPESNPTNSEEEASVTVVILRGLIFLGSAQSGQFLTNWTSIRESISRKIMEICISNGGSGSWWSTPTTGCFMKKIAEHIE